MARVLNDILLSSALPDGSWKDRPIETQNAIYRKIVSAGAETIFGSDHELGATDDYAAFTKKVPVRAYEDLFPYIEKMMEGQADVLALGTVRMYAKSSGTTNGRSKYLPTAKAYLRANHLKAGRDIIAAYMRAHPETGITSRKSISISGTITKVSNTGFKIGDISALILDTLPWWVWHTRAYSKKIALDPSWKTKAPAIAEATCLKDVGSLYGVPTWMCEILELVKKKYPEKNISDIWPGLEVFFYGGVSLAPYREKLRTLIGTDIEYRGVYNASEGVIGFVEDIAHPDDLLLCTDHAIFYEFVPFGQGALDTNNAIPLERVRTGEKYALVLTTESGLWRYLIGDVIEFTSTAPYQLRIVGRTTHYINACGEELVADNAVRAVESASLATGARVSAFTAGPSFDAAPAQARHEWVFEFETPPSGLDAFRDILDADLRERNSDYDAKRMGDTLLGMPGIQSVPQGTFRTYLEQKGRLGGQNKVPILSNNLDFVKEILNLSKNQ